MFMVIYPKILLCLWYLSINTIMFMVRIKYYFTNIYVIIICEKDFIDCY